MAGSSIAFLLRHTIAIALLGAPCFAQGVDTIRVRLLTTGGTALAGATVLATPVGAATTVTATSNADGRVAVMLPHGASPVLVILRSNGLQEIRRTVTRTGSLTDLGDVTLSAAPPAQLAEVKVREKRRVRPPRADGSSSDPAAAQTGSPLTSGLSGDVTGDLAMLASTIPGISVVRDAAGNVVGYSALGLSPEQNVTTIQGMRTSAGSLPRDAAVNTRVALTTFDPSRGGFSGAQMAIQVLPGSRYSSRSLRVTLDAPALQVTDPLARRLGQTPTDVQLSGLLTGPLREGRLLYNASAQVGFINRATPAFAPGNLGGVAAVGADTARVGSALETADRYGLGASSAPDQHASNGSALLRLDLQPNGSWAGNIIASGRWRQSSDGYATPLTVRGSSATARTAGADVVATMSRYIHEVVLNETHLGVTWGTSRLESNLEMPEVQVLTLGQPSDSGQGTAALRFGGVSGLGSATSSSSVELNNETSWSTLDAHHRLRITAGVRGEQIGLKRLPDAGLFTYESEQTFSANLPSSFSRLLGEKRRDLPLTSLAASAADVWTPTPRLRLQYGVRLDGLALPALDDDDAVRARFALRAPGTRRLADLSPRASITWAYGSRSKLLGMGEEPSGTIRAGFGVFQEVPTAGDLLPFAAPRSGTRALTVRCVGSATPIPDWAELRRDGMAVPSCAEDQYLAQRAPDVTLLSNGFRFPRSGRASMGWEGPIGGGWRADAEVIVSSTSGLPGVRDVNFAGVEDHALLDDGRPVFVPASAIDTASGRVALAGSRLSSEFGQVRIEGSTLAAHATQLTIRVGPEAAAGPFDLNLAYTLASYRSQSNGFRGTTSGDPRVVEWGRAAGDRRHQFNVIGTGYLPKGITASLWGRLSSGLPYTPIASADLNGDGMLNDRAFIPAGTATDDRDVEVAKLLASSAGRVRDCLLRNQGRIAERASCEGPWSADLNAQLRLRSSALFHTQRLTTVLTLTNLPAALDYAVHGSKLAGWGQGATVDPVLWTATGYSPATSKFGLRINPGFGRTLAARSGLRTPFRLTLDFRVALGPPRVEQLYRQSVATRGVDSAARFIKLLDQLAANFPNTPKEILRIGDSLHLSPTQVGRLQALQQQYYERSDAIWTPVARLLLAQPEPANHHASSLQALSAAQEAAADLVADMAVEIKKVVMPAQIRLMHPLFAALLDEYRVRDLLIQPF